MREAEKEQFCSQKNIPYLSIVNIQPQCCILQENSDLMSLVRNTAHSNLFPPKLIICKVSPTTTRLTRFYQCDGTPPLPTLLSLVVVWADSSRAWLRLLCVSKGLAVSAFLCTPAPLPEIVNYVRSGVVDEKRATYTGRDKKERKNMNANPRMRNNAT